MFRPFIRLLLIGALFVLGARTAVSQTQSTEPRKSSYDLPASNADFRYIRVVLQGDAAKIKITSPFPYRILDKLNRVMVQGKSFSVFFQPREGGVLFGEEMLRSSPVTLESQGTGFGVNGRTYRHMLQIWNEGNGKLLVVNEIPVEDYLKGVLPSEMVAEWPLESLKAQAVASRTFALFRMMERRKDKYDLTKDVLSQVYKGRSTEHAACSRAVRETQGQILTYRGKVFPAFFHSTCGGRTADLARIWNLEKNPALQGVRCDFCRTSRHYRWESHVEISWIESQLKKAGYSVSEIRGLKLKDFDPGGRPSGVEVEDARGKKEFKVSDFRILVGPNRIKSTLIEKMARQGSRYYFKGRGWGHGVGLCQYGAKRLGELGYAYTHILKYYYPDTEITPFWPPPGLAENVQDFLQEVV